ncbi:unnamed protein product [Phaedon cochleariae]|uniref:UBX domain-containing protein n=1 Tax=Phaedon cochleariae TaxID=80249 RepID=A0A9N9SFQ5_PHACE|nr:unnamed protein product [Phaedon cochleariae]
MSGGSVSVLAPNGRRQTVKCTPNTTLLQVLEEVCKKQSFDAGEYDLKHHNKVLDTTTTFRFSGLPNNAQLEMAPASKLRLESEITLAVNLENGNRLIGSFTPSVSLVNVLEQLCPESLAADKHPVVIYTRREIYGKELGSVTLRALGLTGGRAMIRLINKPPEELKTQANVATLLPSKPVEEKPYQRKFQPLEKEEDSSGNRSQTSQKVDDSAKESSDTKEIKPEKLQKKANVDLLKLAREKRKNNDYPSPHQDEKRKSLSESQVKNGHEVKAKQQRCTCKRDSSMEVDCCGNCEEACTNIEQNMEDEFVFLGERNAMLFSLETAQAVPSEDLPDDFFDLTIDDARKILRDVKKQRFHMDNTPLMTSALRNLENSKNQLRQLNRYKKAVVRVQFPDRAVLQGTFKPTETVKDVVEFVRGFLQDTSTEFYVYSTPPKCILDENKRLIELGFVPGVMIHFGTNNPDRKSDFLKKELQDKFTSNSVASLAASKMRSENTRTCGSTEPEEDYDMEDTPCVISDDGASTSTGITHDTYGERKIVRSTENVPKWFKP